MNLDDLIPAIQGRNWYAVAALAHLGARGVRVDRGLRALGGESR